VVLSPLVLDLGLGGLGTGGIVSVVWAPAVSIQWSGPAGPIVSGPAILHTLLDRRKDSPPFSLTPTHLKGHSGRSFPSR
jgi:hypothetical protein